MRSLCVEENNQTIDAQELEKQGYTDIHFQGHHLIGGVESNLPYHKCFFGKLDSKGECIESKPVYHLIGETDYNTKDSKESFAQTLQIFLGSNTLTLLNYSLLDSSLNIKLECKSIESKEILEREKAQREQQKQDSKMSDSLLIAYNNTESKKVV